MQQLTKDKYLSHDEQVHLAKILNSVKTTHPRNYLMFSLALETGARVSEVLNIKASDLDDHAESVLIYGIKGSYDREIPLRPDLYSMLKNYAEGKERLFPITHFRFRKLWYFYRPTDKKLHSLRHTFAINLYRKTKDIKIVQVALGHKSLLNTLIYSNYSYRVDELKEAMGL